MRTILALAINMLVVLPAGAVEMPSPPSPMVDPQGVPSSAKGPAVAHFSVGAFRQDFGKDSLENIIKSLATYNQVEKRWRATAGNPFEYVCYDLKDRHERLWLSRFNAAGGGVDSVTAKILGTGDMPSGACPALPAKFQPVVVDNKVRLGMSRSELVVLYGKPGLESSGWLVFRGRGDGLRTSVTVRIQDDKVVFLYAENVSAN